MSKSYVVDRAVDKADPNEGYDIVESTPLTSYHEARQAFDRSEPKTGEHIFLGKIHEDNPNDCTTLDCK